MELTKEQIESFIGAYKKSFGEVLAYEEAFEIAHRLIRVFRILEKAADATEQQDIHPVE